MKTMFRCRSESNKSQFEKAYRKRKATSNLNDESNLERDSVYNLITELCAVSLKNSEQTGSQSTLKHLRSIAFGILLQKRGIATSDEESYELDAMSTLAGWQLLLPGPDSKKLQNCLERLKKLQNCEVNIFEKNREGIIRLLLALANSVTPPDTNKIQFSPGQLDAQFLGSDPRTHPQYPAKLFLLPSVEKFEATHYGSSCPYLPPGGWFPCDKKPGTGLRKCFQHDVRLKHSVGLYDIPNIPYPKKPLEIFVSSSAKLEQNIDEGYGTPAADSPSTLPKSPTDIFISANDHTTTYSNSVKDTRIWTDVLHKPLPQHRTWEALGSRKPSKEPPFITEVPTAIHKLWVVWCRIQVLKELIPLRDAVIHLKVIKRDKLLRDIQYLLDGIPSYTFQLNRTGFYFSMNRNICLDGVCPDTMQKVVRDFLRCGTLCRKLQHLCDSPPKNRGQVFTAICCCVRDYLRLYQGGLLKHPPGNSLLDYSCWLREGPLQQLLCLWNICSKPAIPSAHILTWLYNTICSTDCESMQYLLGALLQAACRVYLRFLEKWIYEGSLDDAYEEFLIQQHPQFSLCQNRYYWTKTFFIETTAVPTFLTGLESSILECGRAVNLLRLCCPKNKLFSELDSGFPILDLCLNIEQLQKLEEDCLHFEERVAHVCGLENGWTAGKIIAENESSKIKLEEIATRMRKEKENLRLAEIQEQREIVRKEKRERLADLQEQIEAAAERKREQQLVEKAEDDKRKEIVRAQEREEKRLIEEEKKKIIKFYAEQSRIADLRKLRAEWRMKRMKLNEKRNTFLLSNDADDQNIVNNTSALCSVNNDCVPENKTVNPINDNYTFTIENEKNITNRHNDSKNIAMNIENEEIPVNIIKPVDKQEIIKEPTLQKQLTAAQRNKIKVMRHEFGFELSDNDKQYCKYVSKSLPRSGNNFNERNVNVNEKYDKMTVDNGNFAVEDEQNDNIVLSSPSTTENTILNSPKFSENEELSEFYSTTVSQNCKTGINEITVSSPEIDDDISMKTEDDISIKTEDTFCVIFQNDNSNSFRFPEMVKSVTTESYDIGLPPHKLPLVRQIISTKFCPQDVSDSLNFIHDMSFLGLSSLQRSVLLPLQTQTRLVNGCLLKLFLQEKLLMSHIASLRNYFLLQDGEFSQVLSSELFQGLYDVTESSSLLNDFTLNAVLARAVGDRDSNSSHLYFTVVKEKPGFIRLASPQTFACVSLRYSVQWPLSLVLTDSALQKYDQIFSFLFKVQRVAWALEQTFKVLKVPNSLETPLFHGIHICRHEMTQFVHALQNYLMSTVLQASWAEFETTVNGATTLEHLYRMHATYVKNVLYKCLLFKECKPIMEALLHIFSNILKFCEMVRGNQPYSALLDIFTQFQKSLQYWLKLISRLARAGYQPYLIQLLLSVNVSGYYGEDLGQYDRVL